MRRLNIEKTREILVDFIRVSFKDAGFTKAVIGMSGGIDSAVVGALAVEALGADNVHAILMPYNKIPESINDDVEDAKTICRHLKMKYHIQDITDIVDSTSTMMKKNKKTKGDNFHLRLGNIMARTRMITLFDYSSANSALVLGTENFSEAMFGYFTMFGDSASSIEPIYHLFKTEVFELASHLGLPNFIINKKPSARLWVNHTDEGELGISYQEADEILYFLNYEGWDIESYAIMGFDVSVVKQVISLVWKNKFKHDLPIKPWKTLPLLSEEE